MEDHHGACSKLKSSRNRLNSEMASILFPLSLPMAADDLPKGIVSGKRTRLLHSFGAEIGARKTVDVKEVLEAFEFHHRTRGRLLASGVTTVVDLACGHGLAGLLFALMEPAIEWVFSIDQRRPPSYDALLSVAESTLPGSCNKMRWITEDISLMPDDLREAQETGSEGKLDATRLLMNGTGLGFIGVHCCGSLTDHCIDVASLIQKPLAIMPCCYGSPKGSPLGVRRALGSALASDIDRSYRLESSGLMVDWSSIPRSVTPMNRIIVALPRKGEATDDREE
jgi:hypothetical protein